MSVLDLAKVTGALIRMLEEGFKASPAWVPPGSKPKILPVPPDKLPADSLGLYLYHLIEDPHVKNRPPPGSDVPPVSFMPMGLDLHYQLTTNSKDDSVVAANRAQLMMSVALKTFHDHPVLNDDTEVNGVAILQDVNLDGADNCFRVTLEPMPHEDAVSYWMAGTSPLRLSTYYSVSIVYLEPERARARSGRVLTYGVFTFTSGTPRLLGSTNTLEFTIPGETDPRTAELRPAQVPVGGSFAVLGTGLTGGDVALRLRGPGWVDPVEVDLSWGVAPTGDRVVATVQQLAGSVDVLPGTYAAAAVVTSSRRMPDGSTRRFRHVSNETPFTITPRIDSVSSPTSAGLVTVKGYRFQHPDLRQDAVEAYFGETRLEATTGAPGPGEFSVTAADTLSLRLPGGLASGAILPVRILVNGAESPPNWIVAP
jgi:hypothetical protein